MWSIFQESGNSRVAMHLLKKLDNHSDTMQLAIFKNSDGMSLGELLDFILMFLMRSWISYALVSAIGLPLNSLLSACSSATCSRFGVSLFSLTNMLAAPTGRPSRDLQRSRNCDCTIKLTCRPLVLWLQNYQR